MIARPEAFLSPLAHRWAVLVETARAYFVILNSYAIQRVRNPLTLTINFATWRIAYGLTGHTHVAGASISGFLLIGSFGNIIWFSTLWSSGFAIERARHEGTSAALFLSPASRPMVIVGYGLGALMMAIPAFAVVSVVAVLSGARFHLVDPLAAFLAFAGLVAGTLACGFALAGIFILSRRGNIIATLLQMPIYFLAGFVIPISRLPAWVQPFSNALPVTHAAIALRQTALLGYTTAQAAPEILACFGVAAVYCIIGYFSIRRVEHVAKYSGQLDLY
jgi:ABC-2 type transport system permease protein